MTLKAHGLLPSLVTATLGVAVIMGGIYFAPSVNALEENPDEHMSTTEIKQTTTVDSSETSTHRSAAKERHEAAKEKLSAAKLQICKNREAHIDKRVVRISERVTKHLALFDSIAERVQTFYVTKGNTLENYDALVADMTAKKATAKAAIEALETQKGSFDCESTDPKGAIMSYKTTLMDTIAVLKEYRTSVKNLIVGVKSVNGTDQATKTTGEAQ